MIEADLVIQTRQGQMPAFAVHPDRAGGPFAPVIFYMDAPGFREELKNMARRIAREGYFVVLPDLYYRLGTIRLKYDRTDEHRVALIRAALASLNNQLVYEDTASMLLHLDGLDIVKPGAVGAVGHCMSGGYVTMVAARFASRIAAAASFYGTRIITDKPYSPHLIGPQIKGEMLFAFAEADDHVPPETAAQIRQILDEAEVRNEVDVIPGTQHGFCFPERGTYNPEAAEVVWEKMRALFKRTLG
jgi:carboxymethylenebutenolidase